MHDLTRDYEVRRADEQDGDSSPYGEMSPLIRELILDYSLWGRQQRWDATALDRPDGSP